MIDQGRCEAISRRLDDGDSLRPELIYRLAKTGDPDCAEIVRDVGTYIGIAASNMINLLAPDHLVICGSVDTADELILSQVRHQVERTALPAHREHVQIRLSEARERSPLLGAAAKVAQQWFELPRLR
jgi:predicted NBD/HSP70 family sugar kinase